MKIHFDKKLLKYSIYGAPADCIWGGGRVGFGDCDSQAVLKMMQKYVKQKTLDEMLQELPGAGQFIIVMDTWFERLMVDQ